MTAVKQHRVRMIAIMLCMGMLLSAPPAATAGEAYTCGAAAEYIAQNADAYQAAPLTAEDLLRTGTKGAMEPDAALTHAAGCELLYRAFGPLPEATGVRRLAGYRSTAFTDVPEAYAPAVRNLTDAGLYIPEDDALFLPDAEMTAQALALLVGRIHAYLGASLRDDYYATVTAGLLFDDAFFNAQPQDFDFEIYGNRDTSETPWIETAFSQCLAEGEHTEAERRVAAFVSTYFDHDTRSGGLGKIGEYLDAIWAAQTPAELQDTLAVITRETGREMFFFESDTTTTEDGTILYGFRTVPVPYPAEDFTQGHYVYDAMNEQQTRLLSTLGIAEPQRGALAQIDVYHDLALAQSTLDGQEEQVYTAQMLTEAFPTLSLPRYFRAAGYENTDRVILIDPDAISRFAQVFTADNLEGWKSVYTKLLLDGFWICAPADVADASRGLWGEYYAADPAHYSDTDVLYAYVAPALAADLCRMFNEENDLAPLRENIRWMFDAMAGILSEDIRGLTWMTDTTKAAALTKLAAMKLVVLWPDAMDSVAAVDYVSKAEGGTLFDNLCRYRLARRARYNARIGETLSDMDVWLSSGVFQNNAFYYPEANTVFIPLGFITSREYGPAWPVEEQLAVLGATVGHEMTHGFDGYGAQFDANGRVRTWWTDEDYERFHAKCHAVAAYYAGMEFLPGFTNDPEYTADENIADMGGLKITLALAATLKDFDYDLFFRTYTQRWATSATRPGARLYLAGDAHSAGRIRVNKLLPLFDAFYSTYGIEPGDAMYVAPENRVSVW